MNAPAGKLASLQSKTAQGGIHAPEVAKGFNPPAEQRAQPPLRFPQNAIVGSLGDLSRELAKGTEVPEEFVFVSALTCLGALASGKLSLGIGLPSDTRLYTIILGESAVAKKSSAMKRALGLEDLRHKQPMPHVQYGVGSAEGLAKQFELPPHNILLALDELRGFVEKTRVQASVLLPMTTALFEQMDWDNCTKNSNISLRDVRLSVLACCTTDTYQTLWTPEAIAIGFLNRLFVVTAERQQKVALPGPRDDARLAAIRRRIEQQLSKLPLRLEFAEDAKRVWKGWYDGLEDSLHAKRLDTIGLRLLPLYALTRDRPQIDRETVELVIDVLDYVLRVRRQTDPVDADNVVAMLEERIRRALKDRGRLGDRKLGLLTNARRAGLWYFQQALKNLLSNDEVVSQAVPGGAGRKGLVYELAPPDPDDEPEMASQPEAALGPPEPAFALPELRRSPKLRPGRAFMP